MEKVCEKNINNFSLLEDYSTICDIFEEKNITSGKSLKIFEAIGRFEGLYKIFKVNPEFGLMDDQIAQQKILIEKIRLQRKFDLIKFLFFSLFLSIMVDLERIELADLSNIFIQIVSIVFVYSILFYISIITGLYNTHNYSYKDQNDLRNKSSNQIMVKRNGSFQNLNANEIIFGDIILVPQGVLPFSGILIKDKLTLFEKSFEGIYTKKTKYEKDPFILTGSFICECGGEILVCSEGKEISQDYTKHIMKKLDIIIESKNYPTIKLPPKYIVSDPDLKTICDYFNDREGWIQVLEEEYIYTKKKEKHNNIPIFLTVANINNHSCQEIYEAITDINKRLLWDKNFEKFDIVETSEFSDILYMILKSPSSFIQSRDLIQQRKVWHDFPNINCKLIHFKSVEHKKIPASKQYVRAHTIISGYFIETLSLDPLTSRISIISHTDICGNIPKSVLSALSARSPKEWIKALKNFLDAKKEN